MKKVIKNLWQIKEFRVFVWQTFNGFISLLTTLAGSYIVGDNAMLFLPVIYAVLNQITKYVNTKYFNDLGVKH